MSGYSWSKHKSNYGGIEQRWLVVESRLRRESDRQKLEKKLKKAKAEAENKLQELSKIEFACAADAAAAAHPHPGSHPKRLLPYPVLPRQSNFDNFLLECR